MRIERKFLYSYLLFIEFIFILICILVIFIIVYIFIFYFLKKEKDVYILLCVVKFVKDIFENKLYMWILYLVDKELSKGVKIKW